MPKRTNHFLSQVPQPLQSIFQAALGRFQLGEMSIHGPAHWLKVFRNATLLAENTSGADLIVVQLFALLHDCERQNESHDPGHGPRAAVHAKRLHSLGKLKISDRQLVVLCDAAERHADGLISQDATIGVCWDADRLDLPRVGMRVDAKYLSTTAAKAMARSCE